MLAKAKSESYFSLQVSLFCTVSVSGPSLLNVNHARRTFQLKAFTCRVFCETIAGSPQHKYIIEPSRCPSLCSHFPGQTSCSWQRQRGLSLGAGVAGLHAVLPVAYAQICKPVLLRVQFSLFLSRTISSTYLTSGLPSKPLFCGGLIYLRINHPSLHPPPAVLFRPRCAIL